jgi:hypothetical protein
MYKYEYDLELMICDIYSISIFNSTIRQVLYIYIYIYIYIYSILIDVLFF